MEVNLSACDNVSSQIDECISDIKQSYDCEWDDSVHDSFQNYITEAEGYLGEIKEANETLKDAGSALESVDIDILRDECDYLIEEIETI